MSTSFLPDRSLTFPEVFTLHANANPDAVVFTEVAARGRELTSLESRFRDIEALASRASRALRAASVAYEDRVVLCLESPHAFLAWFLAAQRLGAIPVPLPSLAELDTPRAFRERVASVAADCTPRVVVVERAGTMIEALSGVARGATVLVADSFVDDAPAPEPLPDRPILPSFTAFLQYTSGSTGSPKGVVVTHANLVANFHAIAEGAGFGPDERALSWLPLYHDMGLIGGFLLGIYMNTRVFIMRPRTFAFRPDSWLRAMTVHRATFTVAPNFAYSLVGRKLPDAALRDVDLRALRLTFNGAEPIDRATVDAFMTRLAPHGLRPNAMYPVYGLAECTLAVAFPEPGSLVVYDEVSRERLYGFGIASPCTQASTPIICLGRSVPGHRIRILEPGTETELPERMTGEVVVSGPSVSPGYFGKPADRGLGVRTGDLGYLVDGKLHVVDRIKDLIIVRGKNIAPSDVERAVARVEGITRGAVVAFAEQNDEGTERLVVVAALDGGSMRAMAAIRKDIEHAVLEAFGVAGTEIRLVAPGTIPKTSSGKVRRRACRDAYVRGELVEIDGVASRARVVATRFGRRLGALLTMPE